MREILVLGAGHSAPYLIRHLLNHAAELDARVTVADRDGVAAEARVGGHERGRGVAFDIDDEEARRELFQAADVVVHLLPPSFQPLVARLCLAHGAHMVSASYKSRDLREVSAEAERKGLLLLCEMGLDPGIDVMSAEEMIDDVHAKGGTIESFVSYGGGLPAPEADLNPLNYCITWNPRNVVMAGHEGAEYLRNGNVHLVPWHRLFTTCWNVDVPGVGTLEAYPNRDSLHYRDVHGLDGVETLVRGTLRYPGFCNFWHQLVRLGLPNEHLEVPGLAKHSFSDLVEMVLPPWMGSTNSEVRSRVSELLDIDPEGDVMHTMDWLGLFSEEAIGRDAAPGQPFRTPVDALVHLLEKRLPLPADKRDMVLLHHEIEAIYETGHRARLRSTFRHFGEPGGMTAMARGVGLPAASAVILILRGELEDVGALRPTRARIYKPVLRELERQGMGFEHDMIPLTAA